MIERCRISPPVCVGRRMGERVRVKKEVDFSPFPRRFDLRRFRMQSGPVDGPGWPWTVQERCTLAEDWSDWGNEAWRCGTASYCETVIKSAARCVSTLISRFPRRYRCCCCSWWWRRWGRWRRRPSSLSRRPLAAVNRALMLRMHFHRYRSQQVHNHSLRSLCRDCPQRRVTVTVLISETAYSNAGAIPH